MVANVPNYMIYATHIGIFITILFIRLGALYLYGIFCEHQISRGNTEILRIGSDLTLMGLGIFLGVTANKNFIANLTMPYIFYLAFFALIFVVNYCLFLSMADKNKDMSIVFRLKKKEFAISLFIGFITLNLHTWVV